QKKKNCMRGEKKKLLLLLLFANPEYDVLFRKYAGLISYMPLSNKDLMKQLVDAGLLKAITGTLLAKHDDREAVIAASNMLRDLVTLHPHLSQQLARENAQALLQGIQAHPNDPDVLKHIFGAVKALANAEPSTMEDFRKIGLEDELNKIIKQDNTSVEVQQLVQEFLDGLLRDNLGNLEDLMTSLSGITAMEYQPDGVNIQEREVKEDEPQDEPQDQTEGIMAELAKLATLLDDSQFASKYVQEGLKFIVYD
ncbi:hypothetical protein RFI_12587, partial [Reticulomyxa filosa]